MRDSDPERMQLRAPGTSENGSWGPETGGLVERLSE